MGISKITLSVAAALCLCVRGVAAVPPMISYQGKLLQPSGAAVPDGTYAMQFAIYDVPIGGTALWSETNPSVQVKGGLFATMLGSVINLPANIFDNPNRFFGVKIGSDPEMMPRQQVTSAAFAFRAAVAGTVDDGAITTSKLVDGAVTAAKLGDGSVTTGKIGDAAVSAVQIADGSVVASKIVSGAVVTSALADGAVTAAKIEAQAGWVTPALMNGWVTYHSAYNAVEYMKDSLGFVHIRGIVKSGTISDGSTGTVFALPVGYRPIHDCLFAAASGGTGALSCLSTAYVRSTGDVVAGSGCNSWFSIDGIVFKAEQ